MNVASPRVVSVATAVPATLWPQEAILELLARHFPFYRDPRVQQIFQWRDRIAVFGYAVGEIWSGQHSR